MAESRLVICVIAVVTVSLVCKIVCFPVVCLIDARLSGDTVLRSLTQEEVGPMLRNLTGKDLLGEAENLRAITFCHRAFRRRGMEELYVAFQVDEHGYERIWEEFGGKEAEKYDFPRETNNPLEWGMRAFDRGHDFQRKLGVVLFEKDLYRRVLDDFLASLEAQGQYAQGAIAGHYLRFAAETKQEWIGYDVLMFKDQRVIYISAGRRSKDFHPR